MLVVPPLELALPAFEAAIAELPDRVSPDRRFVWVVSNAVEEAFQPLVQQLNQVEGLTVEMRAIASDYWGQEISVTGLLTGHDLQPNFTQVCEEDDIYASS